MAKPKFRIEWVGLKDDSMVCSRCKVAKKLMPCPIPELTTRLEAFEAEHRDCLPPESARDEVSYASPLDWILGEDTGTSSKTIWSVMMGAKIVYADVPHDPSDFGRCYRLLKAFPEWRARLDEVAKAFPKWATLVAEWDRLTLLYEEELKRPDGCAPRLYTEIKELKGGRVVGV